MATHPKTHMICGQRWHIEDSVKCEEGMFGECVWGLPGIAYPTLRIPLDGDDEVSLDTCIHECLHASARLLDEDFVTDCATDIARLLWRLGWRKDPDMV